MDGYLRQSTASQARLIGPFVDDTDFKTAKTALTINNTDIILRANGTTLSNKNSGGGTHQANGMYSVSWDATDTANVGELKYSVVVAGALQVFGSYCVLEEAVYDALFASGAVGYASATAAAGRIQADNGSILLKQSTAYTRVFRMISSSDHVTPKTGAAPVVTLGKAGAVFAAAAGTVSEIAAGYYKIELTIVDTGSVGDLAYHITGTGADDVDFADQVLPTVVFR